MSVWSWDELERRFYACAAGKGRKLMALFEGYLRHTKDDNDLRLYYQDVIRESEARRRAGDPHHHPGVQDGIDRGTITLGAETRTGVPYRVELRRTGALLNTPSVNAIIAGPVGSGKTNLLAYITLQALPLCRVIVFARNPSYRKRIPQELRDQCKVIQLEELKLCPTRPTYLGDGTPLSVVAEETHKTVHWFCTAFGQRFSRHDALLLMHRGIELLLEDLKTLDPETRPEKRGWPGYHDILKLFDSRAYRARLGGRSQHEESLTLTLKNFGLNGLGVLDARRGINVHELLDTTNLVIETSSYSPEDAAFLIELLLGQLWLRQQHTKTSTPELKYLVVLDDLQDAMQDDGAVHRLIRVSRHAGFSFLLAPQNLGALSNDVLGNVQTFVLVGPQTNQRDLTLSMAAMGLSFKDDMTLELQRGELGRAIARQPFAAYRFPTLIHVPFVPEMEYGEAERKQRTQSWLEQHVGGEPESSHVSKQSQPSPQPTQAEPQPVTSAEDQLLGQVKAFVVSVNELWFEGHEKHFSAAGVKGGTEKEVLLRHARALGWLHAEDASVMGKNGKLIRLAIVTDLARQQLNLDTPETLKQTRGKHSTRYYQHTLGELLRTLPGIVSVEPEGQLGAELKRVDLLARLQDGKAICVEFASTANAEHEKQNARILDQAASQIAKYIVVAETGRLRDQLRKNLADPRITVISFYDAIKQPTLLCDFLKNQAAPPA
ncbi:MAG: hypothetical protein BroJett014_03860 [Planctomycetota bacterium]|nr:hypothetical protein [Planctomycetota bacterium]GIK51413.1 MAG: hypothetical protein BroJett014_03860 [Planctomycetota bacterium]